MNETKKQILVDQFAEEAEEHWRWLESTLHKIYVDALLHGYKHGIEDKE